MHFLQDLLIGSCDFIRLSYSVCIMKKLTPFIVLILSLNAQAYDTSGCSQTKDSSQAQSTVKGKRLVVSASIAPRENCWNAEDGRVMISYVWGQDSSYSNSKVSFWMRVNEDEGRSVNANNVTCNSADNMTYSPDTSGRSTYVCQATAYVKVGYKERLKVEVAPVKDGNWDTRGSGQNYIFDLLK